MSFIQFLDSECSNIFIAYSPLGHELLGIMPKAFRHKPWGRNQLGLNHSKAKGIQGFFVSLVLVNIIFNSCYGYTLPERACVQFEVLKEQVAAIAGVGRGVAQIYLVCPLCPFLDWETQFTVIHDLVMSHLDDYNVLYTGLPLSPSRNYSWFRMWQPVQFWALFVHAV